MQIPNHTQISNAFIEQMHKYTGAEVKLFMAISRKTIGWHKVSDRISYSQLSELTGLSVRHIKSGLDKLVKDGWITRTLTKSGYYYDLNMEISSIEIMSIDKKSIDKGQTIEISSTAGVEIMSTTKDINIKKYNKERAPYELIVDFLNEQTNSSFKHNCKNTRQHIDARWRDGFRLDDFKKVIRIKTAQWQDDPKFSPFLRPSTLFNTKFEGYLQEYERKYAKKNKAPPKICSKCKQGVNVLYDGLCSGCFKVVYPTQGEQLKIGGMR